MYMYCNLGEFVWQLLDTKNNLRKEESVYTSYFLSPELNTCYLLVSQKLSSCPKVQTQLMYEYIQLYTCTCTGLHWPSRNLIWDRKPLDLSNSALYISISAFFVSIFLIKMFQGLFFYQMQTAEKNPKFMHDK